MAEIIDVQLCYAAPDRIVLRALRVAQGTTIEQAIVASGVLAEFPELALGRTPVGLHGKKRPLDTVLRARDRIELYRPLVADPTLARRRRPAKDAAPPSP